MGFFDFLFGSKPEASTSRHPLMTPSQQGLLDDLIRTLGGEGIGAGFTPPSFGGPLTAPLTGREGGILDFFGGRAGDIMSGRGGSPLLGQGTDAISRLLRPQNPDDLLSFLMPGGGGPGGFLDLMRSFSGGSGGGGGVHFAPGGAGTGDTIDELRQAFQSGETKESLAEFFQGLVPVGEPGQLEDFFRTNIREPALQGFEEDVLPRIGRSFGGANFFSGERAQADTRAREDLLEALTRSRSDLQFRDLESARARALQIGQMALGGQETAQGQHLQALAEILGSQTAIGQSQIGAQGQVAAAQAGASASRHNAQIQALMQFLGMGFDARRSALGFAGDADQRAIGALGQIPGLEGVRQQPTDRLFDFLGAFGLPRQIEDTGIQRGIGQFQFGENQRMQRINQILQALGLRPFENVTTVTPGQSGLVSDVLAAWAGSGFAVPSDVRLKINIHRLGELTSGLGVYLFRYLWSPLWHIGVMAQEALRVQPNAVIQHPSGYLMVDYSKLRIE